MFMKEDQTTTGEIAMNIDCPGQVSLKRSSSAPMINEISATMSISSPTTSAPPRDVVSPFNIFSSLPRARRFSMSNPGGTIGVGISPRLTPRVNQLRREECIDVVAGREAAHEKEIHSAMQISQSWEDLTFETDGLSSTESPPTSNFSSSASMLNKAEKSVKKIFDPLSLNLSPGGSATCSSPSPTRASNFSQRPFALQTPHYSSFHTVAWKNGSLSPSPTRKAFATRRSLSPISIRPSCLSGGGMKRKFELDENLGMDRLIQPPIKRAFNLIMSNPSRTETLLSPFSSLAANSTGSVGTPESLSSADSPNFSNQLAEESSPSSSRTVVQSDDASMSDNSNDPQPVKPMDADLQTGHENTCENDNR